jgi:hypothetical protein
VKESSAKGFKRAPLMALMMHPSAGVPLAGPLTVTERTRPSEPNTTAALDGTVLPARQARAVPSFAPTAPCAAPIEGRFGRAAALAAGTKAGSAAADSG